MKVIAVERDELYTDQPFSTHAIAPYGMRMLDQLGLDINLVKRWEGK